MAIRADNETNVFIKCLLKKGVKKWEQRVRTFDNVEGQAGKSEWKKRIDGFLICPGTVAEGSGRLGHSYNAYDWDR